MLKSELNHWYGATTRDKQRRGGFALFSSNFPDCVVKFTFFLFLFHVPHDGSVIVAARNLYSFTVFFFHTLFSRSPAFRLSWDGIMQV